jgi:hypothetical protein
MSWRRASIAPHYSSHAGKPFAYVILALAWQAFLRRSASAVVRRWSMGGRSPGRCRGTRGRAHLCLDHPPLVERTATAPSASPSSAIWNDAPGFQTATF